MTCWRSPELAKRVIATGREVSGRRDIRCTVSIGGFVPKPHTPFQWAAQCDHQIVDDSAGQAAQMRFVVRSALCAVPSASVTTMASQASSKDCSVAVTAVSARSSRLSGGMVAGSTAGVSTSLTNVGARCADAALAGERSRSRLVHHPGARLRRGAALGSSGFGSGSGLAVGGLAGRAR